MTLVVTHAKVSGVGDDPGAAAAGEVLPSDWNANHTLTGTASAAQLNANVVQAVTNDTNIQGSIAGQTLTFSWGGTLAAARLNANVVQAITNDTNVTGSISAQTLTLGWTGTLAASRGGFGGDVSLQSGVPLFATGVATFTGTTGSGNFVRATSPTLVTPALGTPSSGTLTSCTGLPLTGLATQAAWTLTGNVTSGSASPTAFTIDGLTLKASPASTDEVMIWDVAGSAIKKATVTSLVSGANVTSIAGNTGAFTLSHGLTNSTNDLQIDPSYFPTFLAGLILSNDGTTPNSVLDISAGAAADSTNAVMMKLAAFTKSTAGAWASGSGSNGMGNGLTIAASTWYHVILANNGGTPDIYFDTSVTGANRPSGISDTKVRRIGSFKTDASSHILAFTQLRDDFLWKASVTDQGATAQGTTATLYTLSVPPGIQVLAKFFMYSDRSGTNGNSSVYISSPDQNDESTPGAGTAGPSSISTFATGVAEVISGGVFDIRTNTSAQIRARSSVASTNISIQTYGWRDHRGKQ